MLAFGGDVYIDAPIRNCLNRRAKRVGHKKAFNELLSDVKPVLEKADLAIVNLETPISPRYYERKRGDPPIFNTTPHLLDALVASGVDAITLAKDHPDETLLIVVHAGVIRGLICHFLDLDYASNLKRHMGHQYIGDFTFDGSTCVRYDELGKPSEFVREGIIKVPLYRSEPASNNKN